MLLGIGFKVILISTVLLGVLVPARARLLAARGPAPEQEAGPFSSHAIVGLIRPLAQLLDLCRSLIHVIAFRYRRFRCPLSFLGH